MTTAPDTSAGRDRDGALLRRAAAAILVVIAAALAVAAALQTDRSALAGGSAPRPTPSTREKKYTRPEELTLKADFAEKLPYKPRVIILGGSRSLRFEPAYIRDKTGLTAFNAGVRNGRPEEAWGLTHLLRDTFPGVRHRYLWIIHAKVLRGWWRVSPTLVLDERFSRYFPEAFLVRQRAKCPDAAARRPIVSKLPPPRWDPDGHIVWSHSDTLKLAQGVRVTINQWFKKNGPGSPTIEPRPRHWFEKTLAWMNHDMDAAPVLVIGPVQPRVLEKIGPGGFWEAHAELLAYLESLRDRYRFVVVDLTEIESFDGDPDNFYDGYHPKAENTRRIIDEVLRRHPDAFD